MDVNKYFDPLTESRLDRIVASSLNTRVNKYDS